MASPVSHHVHLMKICDFQFKFLNVAQIDDFVQET